MKTKVKTYKILNNFVIQEKPVLKGNTYGWIVCDGNRVVIEIKKSLKDSEKVLTLFHELVHFLEFVIEDFSIKFEKRRKQSEKLAIMYETLICHLLQKYPVFINGLFELFLELTYQPGKKYVVKNRKNRCTKNNRKCL